MAVQEKTSNIKILCNFSHCCVHLKVFKVKATGICWHCCADWMVRGNSCVCVRSSDDWPWENDPASHPEVWEEPLHLPPYHPSNACLPHVTHLIWGLMPSLLQCSDGSVKRVTSGSDCLQKISLLGAQGRQELRWRVRATHACGFVRFESFPATNPEQLLGNNRLESTEKDRLKNSTAHDSHHEVVELNCIKTNKHL